MDNKIFPTAAIEAKHRSGLLGTHFDCFISWMREYGYSRHSMRFNVQCVTHFGQYLHRRGIRSVHQLEGEAGQKLLLDYRCYCKRRKYWRKDSALKLYLRVLQEAGVIKSLESRDSLYQKTQEYVTFLTTQRNLSERSTQQHIYWAEKFQQFLGCRKSCSSLPTFGIADVDRFIEQEAVRLKRPSQLSLVGCLRSFLRFLYRSERLSTDLSTLIISPRRYRLASLPSVLTWGEVHKILDSVDRSVKTGLQHYAVLILLATYGLRAGEVAHLKLEDINWREDTIHIPSRKMGKDLWLPFTPQVGKAILEYLKHGRPPSKYHNVFLLTRAPWTPLDRNNIAYVVNRHIQLAGLKPPRHGAHLLRHSFATHLIRAGVPLKHIGDMLGHRNPESTHIYTKTATEQLRQVALEVPEVR